MMATENGLPAGRIWQVGALCRAIADALEARFNPVAVRGEIAGFARASSGHCYFALKDESGQLRCAMFRRAAGLLGFEPRDGALVEVRGRLAVYEPRGDLQLVVESMTQAGQGAWFEQFARLKARLDAEGLFDPARKRPLPPMPRGIGVVTSLGAAALHDVVTALRRRVPHIPVIVAPAAVQGAGAPGELMRALRQIYAEANQGRVDVILLVRGGGSLEDLWAFNDEPLARTIAQSPVPVVSGVGHETDFTIADFVADLRAPTPTAAAELVARPREHWLMAAGAVGQRMHNAMARRLDGQAQRLDLALERLGRPSARLARQRLGLAAQAQRLQRAAGQTMRRHQDQVASLRQGWLRWAERGLLDARQRIERAGAHLRALDPTAVLRRGYAWVSDEAGQTIRRAREVAPGQPLRVRLAQGRLGVSVRTVDPEDEKKQGPL